MQHNDFWRKKLHIFATGTALARFPAIMRYDLCVEVKLERCNAVKLLFTQIIRQGLVMSLE